MIAPSKPNQRMTITEISDWDGSWKLIDGTPYNMTPAPPAHQRIVWELFFALRRHFVKSGGSVYIAQFDVQLDDSDDYKKTLRSRFGYT